MGGIESWWSDGESVPLRLSGVTRSIFVRRMGAGPSMTLLHGYPSSSHDWAGIAPELSERYSLLLPDFLGFGASDKPKDHEYTLLEQTDLVEALWAREGIHSTTLVAHDYAVSVAQELLARRSDGTLPVELVAVHLLNGGLYPDLHRRPPIQDLLLDPEQGPIISAMVTEELFLQSLKPTFAAGFDPTEAAADIWRSVSRDEGHLLSHKLVRYIPDRLQHAERWVSALESTDVPLAFVWGMLDPVSGAHMAERIRERRPDAPFVALTDVGHWPQIEAPDRVLSALLGH